VTKIVAEKGEIVPTSGACGTSHRLNRFLGTRTSVTDEELLISVQAGDTNSLGVLVGRWERPLYRFVYRMMPRPEDASDICQETFLRVMNKAHRFKRGSRFSTWLYQIALNLCRDQARRKRRWSKIVDDQREVDERVDPSPQTRGPGTDPSHAAERNEAHRAVLSALDKIPAEQREVLIMKEFEGLRFREIAEILDCPESTVKSRMYYGLNGLKTVLVRRGVTGP
jgi:RNA polymerase sigma-70 factor (ECF subfamily)